MLTTANIFMLQLFGLHLQKKLNETLYVGYMHRWLDIHRVREKNSPLKQNAVKCTVYNTIQ